MFLWSNNIDSTGLAINSFFCNHSKAFLYTSATPDSGVISNWTTLSTHFYTWYMQNGTALSVKPTLNIRPTPAPTKSPTANPTGFPTAVPTNQPTKPPSKAPTSNPTGVPTNLPTKPPSKAPTANPTGVPTSVPTNSPTPKPTSLPTKFEPNYLQITCNSLMIKTLSTVFPSTQSSSRFDVQSYYYNYRRVWTNGNGLYVYYTTRWLDDGQWAITNTSYYMIGNDINTPNKSLPGHGTAHYQHFPNNNIYGNTDVNVTLNFTCGASPFPTSNPTTKPTVGPTSSPTLNCADLKLVVTKYNCSSTIANLFASDYKLNSTLINNRQQWYGQGSKTGYRVYYSTFYTGWVIDGNHSYVAIHPTSGSAFPQNLTWYVLKEKETSQRECYITLNYTCSGTNKPTTAPTKAPTVSTSKPTRPPTAVPTGVPTTFPTGVPTSVPTNLPTISPTTSCAGLLVSGTGTLDGKYKKQSTNISSHSWWAALTGDAKLFYSINPTLLSWVIYSSSRGLYWRATKNPFYQPPLNVSWRLYIGSTPFYRNSSIITITCSGSSYPTSPPTKAPSKSPTKGPTKKPTQPPTAVPSHPPTTTKTPTKPPTTLSPTANPTFFPSNSPTHSPTNNPSSVPTPAPTHVPTKNPTPSPTSPCQSLQITLTNTYNGYYRKQSYTINGRSWWQSDYTKASIVYVNDHWYFYSTRFNDISATPYLFYNHTYTSQFPPKSGNWTFVSNLSKIAMTTHCYDTAKPTSQPTSQPSPAPTYDVKPEWSYCGKIFYGFVNTSSNENYPIYWVIPTLKKSNITVTTVSSYTPGDFLPIGVTTISYSAKDGYYKALCNVSIYVISNAQYLSYNYCTKEGLSIESTFDQNYSEIASSQISTIKYSSSSTILGRLYFPSLDENGLHCYVAGTKIEETGTADAESTITFLGVTSSTTSWDVIILLFVIVVFLLLTCQLYLWLRKRQKRRLEDNMVNLLQVANEQEKPEDVQAVLSGIASTKSMRKATLTGDAQHVPKSPRAQEFNANKNFASSSTPSAPIVPPPSFSSLSSPQQQQQPQRPPLPPVPPLVHNDSEDVPTDIVYWKDELDKLYNSGFTNEKNNLQMLINNAVKNDSRKIDKEATCNKAMGLLTQQRQSPLLPPAPPPQIQNNSHEDEENKQEYLSNNDTAGQHDPALDVLTEAWEKEINEVKQQEELEKAGKLKPIDAKTISQVIIGDDDGNNNGVGKPPIPPPLPPPFVSLPPIPNINIINNNNNNIDNNDGNNNDNNNNNNNVDDEYNDDDIDALQNPQSSKPRPSGIDI